MGPHRLSLFSSAAAAWSAVRCHTRCPLFFRVLLAALALTTATEGGVIRLAWSDNSDNELGFEIERKDPSGSFAPIASVEENVSAFTDDSATPGLQYEYRVRAFNEHGYSGYTNIASGSIANTPPVLRDGVDGVELESKEIAFEPGEAFPSLQVQLYDAETPASELVFEVIPENPDVIPYESLAISIEGGVATISIDTGLCAPGSTALFLLLSDGAITSEAIISAQVVGNAAPVVDAGPDRALALPDSTLQLTGSATDDGLPNGVLAAEWSVVSGPGVATFSNSQSLSTDLTVSVAGEYVIALTATDGKLSSTDTMSLTVVGASSAPGIIGITVMDAVSNEPLEGYRHLRGAYTLPTPLLPSEISLVAEVNGQIGSIVFLVDGEVAQTEGIAPYAIAGDTQGDYHSWSYTPGREYVVTARAYSKSGGSGSLLDEVTVTLLFEESVAPNIPPSLSELEDLSTLRAEGPLAVPFTIDDPDTALEDLQVLIASSNPDVLEVADLSISGEGSERTLHLNSNLSRTGESTITLSVSDGQNSVSRSFTLSVLVNYAPAISSLGSRAVAAGSSVGPINFTVQDTETPADQLLVTAESSDDEIVPSDGIVIGGSGKSRTLTLATTPGRSGSVQVRVRVSDGVNTSVSVLTLNVSSDGAPTIAPIADQSGAINTTKSGIAVEIGDPDTALSNLTITAVSNNPDLLPQSGIKLSGTGASRSLSLTPVTDAYGSAVVTVTVSDGASAVKTTFAYSVAPPVTKSVQLINFSVERGLAVAEVRKRGDVSFTLWKLDSLQSRKLSPVADVLVETQGDVVILIDPEPITGSAFYQVFASE